MNTTAQWARYYTETLGWSLISIPAGQKGPTTFGWNKPERAFSDPDRAEKHFTDNPTFNMGVLHAPSNTVAFDVDDIDSTKTAFAAMGVDYNDLISGSVRIKGRDGRDKAIFKAPDFPVSRRELTWPQKEGNKTFTVFELRGGAVQDVLPPSIHPDTGMPYQWVDAPDGGLPELPDALKTIWEQWDKFRPQLVGACPWQVQEKVFSPPRKTRPQSPTNSAIEAFNAAYSVNSMLEKHGYKPVSEKRYLSPNSSTGLAGVIIFDDGRAFSHHASDPFDGSHAFDAFEVFCQYEHGGDASKAAQEARALLNMTNDESYDYDKEAVEHGARVAAQIMPSRRNDKEDPLHDIPDHLLSVPGILNDAVNYYETTAIKTQPQFAVQTALALGSVVMGRRFVTDQRNFSSLYFLNIGETGSGKEHPKTVIETVLDHSGLGELIGPSGYTSSSGVFSSLIAQPTHVAVMDELGRELKSAASKGNQHKMDAITSIMEVFGRQDGTLRPRGFSKMGMTAQQAAEFDKVVRRPSMTLLGMSTPSEFYSAIGGGDVASGLLNRFVIVKSNIGVQLSKKRRHIDPSERLIEWCRECAAATGGDGLVSDTSTYDIAPEPVLIPFSADAEAALRKFEEDLVQSIKNENGSDLSPMYNRSREIAMRLALIISRSTGSGEVTKEAVDWAVDYVRFYSQRTIKMFRDNMADGPFEAACKAVYSKIEASGLRGITASELSDKVRSFANLDKKRRQDVLDVLVEDRGIECRNLNEGKRGRPRFAWFAPPPDE